MDTVTCVQFNPVDESHFISGCIDGIVRIWGISSERVEEWANVQDVVTAVSYQPNGRVRCHILAKFNTQRLSQTMFLLTFHLVLCSQGFVVGSLSGDCRFYKSSGAYLSRYIHTSMLTFL